LQRLLFDVLDEEEILLQFMLFVAIERCTVVRASMDTVLFVTSAKLGLSKLNVLCFTILFDIESPSIS